MARYDRPDGSYYVTGTGVVSRKTFIQSAVLALVIGLPYGLMNNSVAWSMIGMALAPLLVDLFKPTITHYPPQGRKVE